MFPPPPPMIADVERPLISHTHTHTAPVCVLWLPARRATLQPQLRLLKMWPCWLRMLLGKSPRPSNAAMAYVFSYRNNSVGVSATSTAPHPLLGATSSWRLSSRCHKSLTNNGWRATTRFTLYDCRLDCSCTLLLACLTPSCWPVCCPFSETRVVQARSL